jgi:ZIP family zinc transporter
MSKSRTFLYGMLSGIVEPIASVLTIIASSFITGLLPYFLSFAAGAMMYVVVEELIPEMSEEPHSNLGPIAFAFGFVLMMILDVTLG